ncbi:MAG: sugar ABC transporter substrate-binding protein [Spirochaetaceae bacterium]
MRRKFVALICVGLLMGTMAFANGQKEAETTEDGMVKVAFIPGDMANESQSFSAKMFQKHGADYGFDVIILDGKGDAQVQAQVVTNAVAQGLKAIFINPNDINAVIPSLMQAKDAGVIVGMFSSDLPSSSDHLRDFFVGVNDNMAGEASGQAFLNNFPEGANIVEIGGQSGHDAQIKRHDGFNGKIAGSKINVIDYKATQQWSTAEAMAIMEDMIVKHGDEIDGVFCHWDNGATGILGALKAASMEDVFIVGVDGNRAGFDQVRSGEQSVTIMQNFEAFAKLSLKLTKDILAGGTIEPVNFVNLDIVDLKNIDNFTAPEW